MQQGNKNDGEVMTDPKTKIQIFDYLSLKLIDWYKEIPEKSKVGVEENFSKLKLLKLLFFVCAASIKDGGNDLLSYFGKFYAMPYGHVESDVYDNLLNSSVISFIGTGIKIKKDSISIEPLYKKMVDDSIQDLREQNKDIIYYDAMKLVELSHSWESWKSVYGYARQFNKFSMPIPTDLIRNESKFYELN